LIRVLFVSQFPFKENPAEARKTMAQYTKLPEAVV
jgi:hypothetical protein